MAGSTRLELATSGVTVVPVARKVQVSEENCTFPSEFAREHQAEGPAFARRGAEHFRAVGSD